jgi:hypothetical protein
MLKGIQPRLCELGKIKIGKKDDQIRKTSGGREWRAPQKLDHFLVTTLERDAKGDLKVDEPLLRKLAEATGSKDGKVREISISLLSDDIDEILTASYCWYDSKRIAARCDGETCLWYRDNKGNAIPQGRPVPCKGEHLELKDEKGNPRFKVHATLNCVIAAGDARWGGVYKFRTTSRITLEQLYGSLQHLQLLTNGILSGLPLRLVVRPIQVNPTVNGTPTSSTVYVVHVELRGPDLSAVQQQAIQIAHTRNANVAQLRAAQAEYLKLLKAPGEDEGEEEQEDVAAEFHPGAENGAVAKPVKASGPEPEDAEIVNDEPAPEPAPFVGAPNPEPASQARPAKVVPLKATAKPKQPASAASSKPVDPADLEDLPM